MTSEMEQAWADWCAEEEHAPVRAVAEKFPPWALWKMVETDQIVSVCGFFEDGTLRVYVDPTYNDELDFRTGCEVFGVNPASLEVWSPPLDG